MQKRVPASVGEFSVELAWVRSELNIHCKKNISQHNSDPKSNPDLSWGFKIYAHCSHSFWCALISVVGLVISYKLQLGYHVRSNSCHPLSESVAIERCSQLENRSTNMHVSRCYLVSSLALLQAHDLYVDFLRQSPDHSHPLRIYQILCLQV